MIASGFLDPTGPLTADTAAFWVFATASVGLAVASVVLVVREWLRLRSALPIVMFASAALWFPNEAMIDTFLGFQYATDSPAAVMTIMDRELPLHVFGVGAMFFLFPWALYQMILRGETVRRMVVVCVIAGVLDWCMEWPAFAFDLFEYYGDNPSRIFGLPLTSMVQNCFIYLFMATVFAVAAPYLRGWRALLYLPIVPGLYLGGAMLMTWPAYLALHAEWPAAVFMPLALLAAAMNAYVPLAMLRLPQIEALRATARPISDPSRPRDVVALGA